MASEFDILLEKATKKGEASIHGAIMRCVDRNGKVLYSKVAGHESLAEDAAPLRDDAVLKIASATKLITSIALLQCVERELIGLDESLAKILPELHGKEILHRTPEGKLASDPSSVDITVRHLLTHTSGLGYSFLDPLLIQWKQETGFTATNFVTQKYNTPLVFQPGQGWAYGSSLDWGGVVVSRLNGNISLEQYFVENVWKPVGISAPFPTFHISRHPAYKARLMALAQCTPEGKLVPGDFPTGDNPDDEEGGAGLAATAASYTAVLQDLISESPTLLQSETISSMFEPQLPRESAAMKMLLKLKPTWDMVAGPVRDEDVNHGLGGALVMGEAPEIGQPKNVLVWGGATNIAWFICKDQGVAGFFGTQQSPFGTAKELVNAWKKDFWSTYRGS